jgi:hypothetical protein
LETFLTSIQGLAGTFTKAQADLLYSPLGHTHTFASLTGKPTTISGYGITDTLTNTVFGRSGAVVAAANDYTFAQLASKPTTISGYGITDTLTNTVFGRSGTVVAAANDYTFAQLASKPTTIAGYGITDFNSLGDARWLALTGGTLTGNLLFTDNSLDIGDATHRPRDIYSSRNIILSASIPSILHANDNNRVTFAGGSALGQTHGSSFQLFGNGAGAGRRGQFLLQCGQPGTPTGDDGAIVFEVNAVEQMVLTQAGQLRLKATAPALRYDSSAVNAAVAVTLGSTGPTGSTAGAPQGWVPVSINGTTRYMPFW